MAQKKKERGSGEARRAGDRASAERGDERDTELSKDGDAPRAAASRERVEASTMPDRSDEQPRPTPPRRLWLLALLAPLLLVVIGFSADRALYAGRVLRGVELGGPAQPGGGAEHGRKALDGLDAEGARGVLATYESELRAEPLLVKLQQGSFELTPEEVGLALKIDAALDEALRLGRDGGLLTQLGAWLTSFTKARTVTPTCALDEAALDALFDGWEAEAITDPPYEGAIVIEDDQPVAKPPRAGHRIDRARAAGLVVAALCERHRQPLELPLMQVAPARTVAITAAALEVAKDVVRGPITLVAELPPGAVDAEPGSELGTGPTQPARDAQKPTTKGANGKGANGKAAADGDAPKPADEEASAPRTARFTFEPKVLAGALRSKLRGTAEVELFLDPEALEPALAEARGKLEIAPIDARFVVQKGDKIRIVPGHKGRVIDARKVAEVLFEAAKSPQREAAFPIEDGDAPKLSTEDAEALGIKGLIAKFTTTHPCCKPRVDNIHRIADLIDGVLVKPGDTFSINAHVGERTPQNGFKPAPTIVLGEMKDTIGGGISQFATTFFNAALNAGLEIVERQPHSYYFSRYPMGHEATLSFPKPDVIIKNDTAAGLLIKAEYTAVSITVKLFGDNGGRKVSRKVSQIYDLTDPPVEYAADDRLEPDDEKVVTRGKRGWTVDVSRTITFPDGTEKKEVRKVVYKPRLRELRVHSCRIPKGEPGHTGRPCPEPKEDDEDGQETAPAAGPTDASGDEEDAD